LAALCLALAAVAAGTAAANVGAVARPERIAFAADRRTGICDVWTVTRHGTGLRRVTHGLGAGTRLSWIGG
jgi:hypothetical protein